MNKLASSFGDGDGENDNDDDGGGRGGCIEVDHNYSIAQASANKEARIQRRRKIDRRFMREKKGGEPVRYKYNFLLSVVKSGERKQIKNNLAGAVAILSNSKTIFLGHINTMLRCLDPGLAEICYTDTDSVIFSLTYPDLNDCIRPSRRQEWQEADVLFDEKKRARNHGLMKLEGTYRVGHFKTLKIYRLFDEKAAVEASDLNLKPSYTRCKGVNRGVALKLPDSAFDVFNLDRIVVHRTALRPIKTGEMTLAHEARTLARPFNLKRFTTSEGIHTLPLSFISDDAEHVNGDGDEDGGSDGDEDEDY